MKKTLKIYISVLLAVIFCFGFGCNTLGGKIDGEKVDDTKTQIYISAYDGGNGIVWLEDLAKTWNENNDKYQIIILGEKITESQITNQITTGAGTVTAPSVYFSGVSNFQSLIYGDYLEDLSDILEKEVDGNGKGKVKDKLGVDQNYYDYWMELASKNGSGTYMLPLSDNFGLMVFDFDSFLEKGFMQYADALDGNVLKVIEEQGIDASVENGRLVLASEYSGDNEYFNYEVGDYILTCGKDGVYGTYDDGQPTTESEFDILINKIKLDGNKSKAFIWTSDYSDYTDMIVNSAMVQYIGIEEENVYYSYDGKITIDGQQEDVTLGAGYKVFGNDGLKKGIEFVNKYLNNTATAYTDSLSGSISHTEAQGRFLYSYLAEAESKEYGHILVEGEWFENEARAAFNQIQNDGRGFGSREYRILFLPKIDGQKGIDGKGNGSVVSCLNNGAIIVPKQADADKLNAIKEFICEFLKNENLQQYMVKSGSMAAYRYELTNEQYESLTPFAKNCYQIRKDTKNVYLSRFCMRHQSDFLTIASSSLMTNGPIPYYAGGQNVISAIKALRDENGDVGKVINGTKNYYSETIWSQIVNKAKERGFIN